MNTRAPLSGLPEVERGCGPLPADAGVGGLVESPDYAFAFRELEPVPAVPRRLVVALHGADGDEQQFADALAGTGPDDVVVLPRAPRSLPGGRLGWFREVVGDGDARADAAELDDALARLRTFVGEVQRRHDVAPADTVLVGFSQGGALALSAAVTEPGCCGAVAVVGGRLPRRVEPLVGMPPALRGLRVLLVHAPDDDVLAPERAEEAAGFLAAQALVPAIRFAGRGHALAPAAVAELRTWLAAPRAAH